MSKPYFVYIVNHSGATQNYLFFNAPPYCTDPFYTPNVRKTLLPVWLTQPGVAPGGDKATFQASPEGFAVAGTTPASIVSGQVASVSSSMPVPLNGDFQHITTHDLEVVNGVPRLNLSTFDFHKVYSFCIHSGAFNESEYHVFAGLGKHDDQNKVVPAAIWQAQPGQRYIITPRDKYFVSIGSHQQGTILGVENLGLFISIDFQDAPERANVATITHHADGSFSATQWSFA
ncbi:uncharacterized protein FSUBG_12215 [Fusarium subglutinans]|uniref:Uncharacterized protein n=1 Tax=Gibberella subglutinans TaxID=42677 RepID=A0A8H5L8P7_GIBSU|nr:uncharacterized protein FSUBG_12215 [Fusarium subglutinans]KAF5586141.1 hypothetical protein FSUBG_12215 [Fusarium subglutinans]